MNLLQSYIFSGLGIGLQEHWEALIKKKSSIQPFENKHIGSYQASTLPYYPELSHDLTRFENLVCHSIETVLQSYHLPATEHSLAIVLSTTKGNIDLIEKEPNALACSLTYTGERIRQYLRHPNPISIISNACISGVQAFMMAEYLLQKYDYVLVCGADILTDFVLYGFHSFRALSTEPCKPYDIQRNGLNLGEAVAAVLVSQHTTSEVKIMGCSSSNDANHISGPSRTGEGLALSIQQTLSRANIQHIDIQAISSHGTATLYNDEMESLAFATCQLTHAPVFSLKHNFGHTLGTAGIIEVILSAESLKKQILLPSAGFENLGTSVALTIPTEAKPFKMKNILKTASGFGGGNASLILQHS